MEVRGSRSDRNPWPRHSQPHVWWQGQPFLPTSLGLHSHNKHRRTTCETLRYGSAALSSRPHSSGPRPCLVSNVITLFAPLSLALSTLLHLHLVHMYAQQPSNHPLTHKDAAADRFSNFLGAKERARQRLQRPHGAWNGLGLAIRAQEAQLQYMTITWPAIDY